MLQSTKKVFVIDDDVPTLNTVKKTLEKEGYCVGTSTNGAEAIDFLSKEDCEPDLILIDILMPTLSGYDTFRLLKDKMSRKVKMAYFSIVPKEEADLKKIDGFIQKPFNLKDLINQVKKLISK